MEDFLSQMAIAVQTPLASLYKGLPAKKKIDLIKKRTVKNALEINVADAYRKCL